MKQNLLKLALAATFALLAASFGDRALAQTRTLTGTVVDQTGNPIPGASVIIEGTTRGTTTGLDGTFTLNDVLNEQNIQVSFIGYLSRTIAVGKQTAVVVTLDEEIQSLDEVVVIGYGVQQKSNVTGSIATIKEDALINRSVENIQQALQGKAAGVQVYSASGEPNSSPQIRIRGFSSNTAAASSPLFIVDGLKVNDIAYLDPSSVASMEILKDGASAAIYGAEAGNGVVLITTKKGKRGGARAFYDFTYGLTSLARKAKLMNAAEYVAYQTAAGNAQLMSPWDGKTDTDWFDALYGDGGSFQRHTGGFETSNENGSAYASLSYMDNDGMYYGNKDWVKRLTFQLNGDYKIRKWLTFTTNNTLTSDRYQSPTDGQDKTGTTSPYIIDPLLSPFYDKDNLPVYMQELIATKGDEMMMKNENGDYAGVPFTAKDKTSPMTWYYSGSGLHKSFALRGASSLVLTPIKDLTFTSRVGYRLESSNYDYYGVPFYEAVSSRMKPIISGKTDMTRFYQWENFANYNKRLGKHSLSAMIGMSYQYSWYNFTSANANELTNTADNFHYLNYASANATKGVGGEVSEMASLSYFGRVGYSYDDRYSVMVNFRADAYDLSKLSRDARWGYFPSVSFGWTISNEAFMRDVDPKAVSFLKLRGSYGVNGNVNVLGGYKYLASMNVTDYYPMGGVLIPTLTPSDVLANPSLQWEESKQVDVGIDARFLNNRLSFTADFFDKNTSGQLVTMTSPLSTGTSTVTRNVGKVNNHGFEFELGWQDRAGDFSYSINANIATLNTKVKSMEGERITNDDDLVVFDIGRPVWSYYGWKYEGVNPEDGSAVYWDKDGNGTIDDKDKTYLGTPIPDFTYGITVNLAYKGLDFTLLGSGSHGNELIYSVGTTPQANRPADFWTKSWDVMGAAAKYPHPDPLGDTHVTRSSMYLKSGSYFKIKQLQLGYMLPESFTRKFAVSRLRIYVSLDNFFCITPYWGMDPEAINANSAMGIDSGNYPTPKTLTFGANVSF